MHGGSARLPRNLTPRAVACRTADLVPARDPPRCAQVTLQWELAQAVLRGLSPRTQDEARPRTSMGNRRSRGSDVFQARTVVSCWERLRLQAKIPRAGAMGDLRG